LLDRSFVAGLAQPSLFMRAKFVEGVVLPARSLALNHEFVKDAHHQGVESQEFSGFSTN